MLHFISRAREYLIGFNEFAFYHFPKERRWEERRVFVFPLLLLPKQTLKIALFYPTFFHTYK
jgi:hypothetical protein